MEKTHCWLNLSEASTTVMLCHAAVIFGIEVVELDIYLFLSMICWSICSNISFVMIFVPTYDDKWQKKVYNRIYQWQKKTHWSLLKSVETGCKTATSNTEQYFYRLTAWEVSSGRRILTASGLLSQQYLPKGEQMILNDMSAEGKNDIEGVIPGHAHGPTRAGKLYLVALFRASNPATHSCEQIESLSLEGFGFGDWSPSLSVFSPCSTSSLTNVALIEKGEKID